ncbi:MAG: LysM peptidoglycan-binding domain-containing protein, partial [Anaerolineae bacterium]
MKSSETRRRTARDGRWAERLGSLASGVVAALLVGLTLLVALVLAMGEQNLTTGQVARATATVTATALPTWTPSSFPVLKTFTPSPTVSPLPTGTAPPSGTPTPSATRQPSPTPAARCVPPSNWRRYTVQRGETLAILAWRFWTSESSLRQANCLKSSSLRAGQVLYVPDVLPRQTCGRPPGWVPYIIQPGDTLYSLARWFGITVAQLKQANCLSSDLIIAGATLWVPYPKPIVYPTVPPTATRRPTATRTPTVTPSPTATSGISPTPSPTASEPATGVPPSDTPPPPTATEPPPPPPTATEPPPPPPTATEPPPP